MRDNITLLIKLLISQALVAALTLGVVPGGCHHRQRLPLQKRHAGQGGGNIAETWWLDIAHAKTTGSNKSGTNKIGDQRNDFLGGIFQNVMAGIRQAMDLGLRQIMLPLA